MTKEFVLSLTDYELSKYKEHFTPEFKAQMLYERNKALIASDWTQLPDVPDTISLVYKDYRQALRDFPATINWDDILVFEDIVFPEPPAL